MLNAGRRPAIGWWLRLLSVARAKELGATGKRMGGAVSFVQRFSVSANDREVLLRLARYGARGSIDESRLSRREDGRYAYETKRGVTLVLTAAQLRFAGARFIGST